MAFLDPPYNVRVRDIVGRGQVKHAEFAMASGELSRPDFVSFLQATLAEAAAVSRDGAVHYVCMDWRHIGELIEASSVIYGEMLNLAVWVKSNAGQGSFYRSQHELVGIFRVGETAHLNNVELGRHGRSRSNVWHYAGINTFRAGRLDELKSHPTVKPVALVADAMRATLCSTSSVARERPSWQRSGSDVGPTRSRSNHALSMPPSSAGKPFQAKTPFASRPA
jgi:DNA modification methylase